MRYPKQSSVQETEEQLRARHALMFPAVDTITGILDAYEFPPSTNPVVRALLYVSIREPETFQEVGAEIVQSIIAEMDKQNGGPHGTQ